jgi:hypothetical protein
MASGWRPETGHTPCGWDDSRRSSISSPPFPIQRELLPTHSGFNKKGSTSGGYGQESQDNLQSHTQSAEYSGEVSYNDTSTSRIDFLSGPKTPVFPSGYASIRPDSPGSEAKKKGRGGILRFWIWEILTIVFSLGLIGAIYAIVLRYDGQRLSTWNLPINLSTLVALLSTISRVSIAVVLAEVISQAKWSWFWDSAASHDHLARPLSELQAFDDASRGPFGALMLISKVFKNPFLVLTLFVAVSSLAIDTFTQQAVKTVDCTYIDATQVSALPTAQKLNHFGVQDRAQFTRGGETPFSVKGAILSSFADPFGNDSAIYPTCATGNCTFSPMKIQGSEQEITHRSLGFCSRCIDITSLITYNETGQFQKTYSWTLPNEMRITWTEVSASRGQETALSVKSTTNLANFTWARDSLASDFLRISTGSISNLTILSSRGYHSKNGNQMAAICTLYPCVQSYFGSIDRGDLVENPVAEEPLLPAVRVVPWKASSDRSPTKV